MDVASKITLIASIILMGFNASQLFGNFESATEKADEFRILAKQSESGEGRLRFSNFAISFILSSTYVVLASFSGFVFWIPLLIALKLAFTLLVSDRELCLVIRGGVIKKSHFLMDKVDSFFNVLLGLSVALALVL